MPNRRRSAADLIAEADGEVRIVPRKMVDNAAAIRRWWDLAREAVRDHPDVAMTYLADAEVHLASQVRIERADALRRVRSALGALAAELPDDPD